MSFYWGFCLSSVWPYCSINMYGFVSWAEADAGLAWGSTYGEQSLMERPLITLSLSQPPLPPTTLHYRCLSACLTIPHCTPLQAWQHTCMFLSSPRSHLNLFKCSAPHPTEWNLFYFPWNRYSLCCQCDLLKSSPQVEAPGNCLEWL